MEAAFHQTRLHLTCTSNPRATVSLSFFHARLSILDRTRAPPRPPRLVFYERRVKSARDIKGLCRSGRGRGKNNAFASIWDSCD